MPALCMKPCFASQLLFGMGFPLRCFRPVEPSKPKRTSPVKPAAVEMPAPPPAAPVSLMKAMSQRFGTASKVVSRVIPEDAPKVVSRVIPEEAPVPVARPPEPTVALPRVPTALSAALTAPVEAPVPVSDPQPQPVRPQTSRPRTSAASLPTLPAVLVVQDLTFDSSHIGPVQLAVELVREWKQSLLNCSGSITSSVYCVVCCAGKEPGYR